MISEINETLSISKKIAEDIKLKKGRMFYVGGYVRDKILKLENKDIDVEVFGLSPDEIKEVLSKYGVVDEFGAKFGIFKVHGIDIDFAMPRTEKSTGEGHKNFEVNVNPNMSMINACKRRDFTINALMEDVLTGEVFDYFDGLKDLQNGNIRHVDDETFVEDELRVLRACQFAARFDFKICNETINLCKKIDCSKLPKERIYGELEKALLKANKPSIFFEYARKIEILNKLFSPMEKLIGLEQNPKYHPEGDVWNHTMMVIDEAAQLKEKSNYPISLMLAAVCHDLGKITTTRVIHEKIVSFDHENRLELTEKFLKNITSNKDLIDSVKILVKNHMRPNIIAKDDSSDKSIRKLIVDTNGKLVNIQDAILLSKADRLGRSINNIDAESIDIWWNNRLQKVNGEETKIIPFITGKDLIDMGLKPNKEFKKILELAFKLQLNGLNREEILKKLEK
jgi:tRNA nucleotidyltransferase (CCA-adding enzyme)